MGTKGVFLHFVWGVIVFLQFASVVHGHLNRGGIEGNVTDSQKALVPRVQVAVTSIDTGVAIHAITNSSGYYRAEDLVPGIYRIDVAASGFSSLAITNVEVLAGEVRRVDAELKLGTTRQAGQDTASATALETTPVNASTTLPLRWWWSAGRPTRS